MLIRISDTLKRVAVEIKEDYVLRRLKQAISDTDLGYSGDSPYLNIQFYQQRTDPSDPGQMIQQGPPSMYEDPDRADRSKNKEDIRRQGPRPQPVDWENKHTLPVTPTVIGLPRENLQGESWNDTTKPWARNENNETIGFDPDELNVNPFRN